MRLDLQPVELNELLQEVARQMEVVAEGCSIRIDSSLGDSVFVSGDRENLRRLFLNLIDNAIKYTPSGGRISLSLQKDLQSASVRITDTGVGLSRDEQERIFRRFHRATESRSRDERGVGLGLSIARSIAEAHGGSIDVESVPGRGSTFTVFLPVQSK